MAGVTLKIAASVEEVEAILGGPWGWTEFWRGTTTVVDEATLVESIRALTWRDYPGTGTWFYWTRLVSPANVPGEFAPMIEAVIP